MVWDYEYLNDTVLAHKKEYSGIQIINVHRGTSVSRDGIFSLKWRYYGPKRIFWMIGEYTHFGLLYYCIISKDKGL